MPNALATTVNLGTYSAATTTGTAHVTNGYKSGQAIATAAGAFSGVTVTFYGTCVNQAANGALLGTITLSGSTSAGDGFSWPANYPYVYATLTGTLTGAPSVSIFVGM